MQPLASPGLLTKRTLKGTWGTVLLPIQADERIDYAALEEELDILVRSGLDGIYTNGSAGEFYNQTEAEYDTISELVADKCRAFQMPFQLGACQSSPVLSLERIGRTKSLRPGAFQVILPDWLMLNSDEQVDFLKRMASAAEPVPLVLYHPPHAKARLQPADFRRLSDAVPELIGVKVAAGDGAWYAAMREHATSLAVFVSGHRLATGLAERVGVGSYSNVACLSPSGARQWYDLMQHDSEEALRIEGQLGQFFQECILPFHYAGYCDPALDKLLAAVGGWCAVGTRLRWPYRGIDSGEVNAIRRTARQLLPEFLVNNH